MGMLLAPAPLFVCVGGEEVPINSDFRVSIRAELLFMDGGISDTDKLLGALALYFPAPPPDLSAACSAMLWFYGCGHPEQDQGGAGGSAKRIYDFEVDDGDIYAAFLSDYGVDLEAVPYLHWWKFKAMFAALKPDNAIRRIMEYRGADLSALKGKERAHYEKMQRLYALPLPAGEAEKLSRLAAVLKHDGKLTAEVLGR